MRNLELSKAKLDRVIQLFRDYGTLSEIICPPSEMGLVISAHSPLPASARIGKLLKLEASPKFEALRGFLESFSDRELQELQVTVAIGQGVYPAEEFEEALNDFPIGPDRAAEIKHMIEKWHSADHLADAFEELNTARVV